MHILCAAANARALAKYVYIECTLEIENLYFNFHLICKAIFCCVFYVKMNYDKENEPSKTST